jgi:uncharacterized membrane protein
VARWALVVVFFVATFVGPTADTSITDFGLYQVDARAVLDGLLPYRDFALEYPPGMLVPTLVPAVLGTGDGYEIGFAVCMCLCLLVVQDRAARLAPGHARAAAWAIVALPVLHGAIVRHRFDLFAVALAVAGFERVWTTRRAHAGGFALLGLGVATKLFPGVLAAAAVAWLAGTGARREAVKGAAITAVVALAVCAPFAALAPDGFIDQFRFHAERPLQVESLPATLVRLAGDRPVTTSFRSQGIEDPGGVAAIAASVQLAATLAALAWAFVAGRRRDPTGLLLAAVAALIAFASLGKVLSPQYLLWLTPFAPALWFAGARPAATALVIAAALTQLEFPARYSDLVAGEPAAITLVALRDATLVLALAALWARARTPTRRTPAAVAGTRT